MIRCPNCKQSFYAYMRGGSFITVSLDGSYLLVDTDQEMKNTDYLNPNTLGEKSILICPQCGEISSANDWRNTWKKESWINSVGEQKRCRCGGLLGTNGKSNVCLNCNQYAGDIFKKYPEIKVDYTQIKRNLRKNDNSSVAEIQAFGWCDY